MHGSCTCCDSHAEAVRSMMTSPRIGLSRTAASAAKTRPSGADNRTAAPRRRKADFIGFVIILVEGGWILRLSVRCAYSGTLNVVTGDAAASLPPDQCPVGCDAGLHH